MFEVILKISIEKKLIEKRKDKECRTRVLKKKVGR